MDIDDRIDSSGCAPEYKLLDECIINANRDWRKCQLEVEQLRKCMAIVAKEKVDSNSGYTGQGDQQESRLE